MLLFCLGTDDEESKAVQLERRQFSDWDRMIQQAVRHGVAPYLFHRLRALRPAAAIPAEAECRLKEISLYSATRNIKLYQELGKVLIALKNEGIPVIVLKGAYLAEAVYENIALRPMVDVDILVKREDLSRVSDILMQLGYDTQKSFWVESHSEEYRHLPGFSKPGAVSIEIHHSIVNPAGYYQINVSALWRRARTSKIAEVEVLALSPEDLLLNSCLHVAYQHRFSSGLLTFCDIIEILRTMKTEIDLGQVAKRTLEWKMERCAYFTLYLIRELLGSNRVDDVLKVFEPVLPESGSVAWAKEQVFPSNDYIIPVSPNLARLWKARGIHDKAVSFMKYVFVSRNRMAAMYSVPSASKRIYFYYLVRIRDVILRYGHTVWCLLFRGKKTTSVAEYEDRGNALEHWLTSESGGEKEIINEHENILACSHV